MKTVGIIAAIVIGLPLVISGLGLLIPKDHVATRSIRVSKSAEEVYRAITDFANAPSWRKGLKRVEMLPAREGKPVFKEHGPNGEMTLEVTEMIPSARLVTRIADDSLPYGGRWVYSLTRDGDGCRLSITEEGFVHNPLFRVLAKYVFGHTSTMERYLADLGAKLGERVTVS